MNESYYRTKETVEEYIKLAEGYNGKQLIAELNKHLPNGSKILEIGSGPGTDWEILNKQFDVTGSDFSTQFLAYLRTKYPKGSFLELDAKTLQINDRYDAIYSNKVLQHLKDEELMHSIERQNHIVNAEGIVCHSFWYGEGSEVFKGMLVNYQTENSIRKLFSTCFEIVLLQRYKEFEDEDSILLIGRKK